MSLDVVVVYSPVGGGHRSAAIAIEEAARARGLTTCLVNAFEHAPRWAGDAYLAAHLTSTNATPGLYGRMYEGVNRRDTVLDPIRRRLDNLVFGRLAQDVKALSPRAVIATHHLPLVVLGQARRRGSLRAPLLGVVTDYSAHACWAEDGVDGWAVSCGVALRELVDHGVPRSAVATTGIPVRAAFERIAPLAPDATRTGPLRVLVTSGGFGAAPLGRIVESFAGIPDVLLTVVCGASPKLESRVTFAARAAGVRAEVLGYESNMPARMAAAHVVVGKAGGLTVTEALTAGRSMVIACAVPGNEKRNEERVVRAGAGVAADPDAVGATIAQLRRDGALERMGRRGRLAIPRGSAPRVLDAALALLLLRTPKRRRAA